MIVHANGAFLTPAMGLQLLVGVMREHSEVSEWRASVQEWAILTLQHTIIIRPTVNGEPPKLKQISLTFAGYPVVRDWSVPSDTLIAKNKEGVEVARIDNLAVPLI